VGLIAEVGDHLTPSVLPLFATIGAAWTSKPLQNFSSELPACLYYLDGIDSEPSPYNTAIIQPGDYRVAVLIVGATAEIEELLAELRAALVGFQPEGSWEPFQHESGGVLEINESVVWWRDVFVTRNYRE